MLFIANDHAGVKLKGILLEYCQTHNIVYTDLGVSTTQKVDYPDIAGLLCREIDLAQDSKGVLICGSGIGMSIAANRYRNIRAALCLNPYMAMLARMHNDANVLCLGERLLGNEIAIAIVESFLGFDFEGGRHTQRVAKLSDYI
ncbi:ribose 5-phosphate isomerase B [Helicobacter aurati]|uniref:Ribose 5-phosphate isomerase B n=1 Tax=Helicobacter aurati TaxID=137778 RepID=A0A3D8J138_9HELI|nr:ribose 5-phosphate isomerase B [Helicobacter aurati]RDU71242.1 ribose 5-phosphate isomerase B [Helicobacter aurati]